MTTKWLHAPIIILSAMWWHGCGQPVPKSPTTPERPSATSAELSARDEAYVAYRNTHEDDPTAARMIVELARDHIAAGEYRLGRFYCDEYRRDFPSGRDRTRIEYLRVRAAILHARRQHDTPTSDQAHAEAHAFITTYPRSPYRTQIQTLLHQLHTDQNRHYQQLAQYYETQGKPKAAQYYRQKIVPVR